MQSTLETPLTFEYFCCHVNDSPVACKHRHISGCRFSVEKVMVKVAPKVTTEVAVVVALNE